MIQVLFFASVRDRLGVESVSVDPADAGETLESLRRHLAARGGAWEAVLGSDDRLLGAVNHNIVPMHTLVFDGDEVAFFPPVTGG